MLKKILIIFLLMPIYTMAQSEAICNPKLIENIASRDVAPLENKLSYNLSFYTPIPDQLITSVNLTILKYKQTNKTINYSQFYEKINNYAPNVLFLNAFGYKEDKTIDKKTLTETRLAWRINCNNNISEIKTNNDNYKVVLTDKNKDTDKYNVFIIPNDKQVVFFLQFRNFSELEIREILSTINGNK